MTTKAELDALDLELAKRIGWKSKDNLYYYANGSWTGYVTAPMKGTLFREWWQPTRDANHALLALELLWAKGQFDILDIYRQNGGWRLTYTGFGRTVGRIGGFGPYPTLEEGLTRLLLDYTGRETI